MNWKRALSWMTFAMAAALGGCVYPPDIDGGLLRAYREATADKGPQPRQAVKGVGSLKPAPVRAVTGLKTEGAVVNKVVQIDETYKVIEQYDNGTEKVDLTRVVTTTTHRRNPETGKVAPVVETDKRGPVFVVYESAPKDVHLVETHRVGRTSGTPALIAGDHELIMLSLEEAILRALANSLDIRVVSYDPAIAREEMTKAAAAFDTTLFGSLERIHSESRQANGFAGSLSQQRNFAVGLRKRSTLGTECSLTYAMTRSWDNSSFLKLVNSYYEPSLTLQVTQPLLRNAWPGFNLAQLRVATVNAKISDEQFRDKVEEVITQVISLYWTLSQSRQSLEIQQRLLEQTRETYGITLSRYQVDATGATISQIQASVKIREAAMILARKNILDVQQSLARLINDPQINALTDYEVVPTTPMITELVEIDPADQMVAALAHNPQLEQARLGIAAAEINVDVARNQTLPKVDLTASAGIQELAATPGTAQRRLGNLDYTSFSIGLSAEYPIGNRERMANLRQRKYERTQAIVSLQNAADQIAVTILERARQVRSAHQQIVAQRAAVKASQAQLWALRAIEKDRGRLTPEFLQLKLSVQQTLANSEQAQLQATVDYNNALVDLARATGTTLELHRVQIAMPRLVSDGWTPAKVDAPTQPATMPEAPSTPEAATKPGTFTMPAER